MIAVFQVSGTICIKALFFFFEFFFQWVFVKYGKFIRSIENIILSYIDWAELKKTLPSFLKELIEIPSFFEPGMNMQTIYEYFMKSMVNFLFHEWKWLIHQHSDVRSLRNTLQVTNGRKTCLKHLKNFHGRLFTKRFVFWKNRIFFRFFFWWFSTIFEHFTKFWALRRARQMLRSARDLQNDKMHNLRNVRQFLPCPYHLSSVFWRKLKLPCKKNAFFLQGKSPKNVIYKVFFIFERFLLQKWKISPYMTEKSFPSMCFVISHHFWPYWRIIGWKNDQKWSKSV